MKKKRELNSSHSWKENFPTENRFYETRRGILYNEDALRVLQEIPDDTIDLVVTSPPYNIGIDYDEWNDKMPWDEYFNWIRVWLKELYRILKKDGRLCLNHYLSFGSGEKRVAPLMSINHIACNEIGFKHHSLAIWQDITLAKRTAWGSWLSASCPYVSSPYEGILILYKEYWKKQYKGKSTIDKRTFINLTRGIWKIGTQSKQYTKANFPETLPLYCLQLLSFEEDLILDPFIGSGTTAVVCEKLNRRWVGIEISENYCELAKRRIDEEARKIRLFKE